MGAPYIYDISRLRVNVHREALVKDRLELSQSLVCCTQRFTDVVLVGEFRVEGSPKIFDLICPINVCMKGFYWGGVNVVVTAPFGKQ